jgi:hypothetical protein
MGRGHSSLRGRNAKNGKFVPVEQARRHPATTTVERVPKPGFGAESSTPRGRDAGNGQFIPVEEAQRRPSTAVVEQVPNPGQGSGK